MRIAYIVNEDVTVGSGVSKKIVCQMQSWTELNHEVKLFALSPTAPVWSGFVNLVVIQYEIKLLKRFSSLSRLSSEVSDFEPDIIYMRYDKECSVYVKLAEKFPLIVEVNTNNKKEEIHTLPLTTRLYNFITRGRLLNKASGFISVTEELSELFKGHSGLSTTIANGINLSEYIAAPPTNNIEPHLLFIGSPGYPWHGIDKIMKLAEHFKGWEFHIIGYTQEQVPHAPGNVNLHGYLNKEQYRSIFNTCDVAIGTLSLHIKGMDEASPLKVREYLACGLPVIIGYSDTDFAGENHPFLLQIPNLENSIHVSLDRIESFVLKWKNNRISRQQILHIDSSIKELQRIDFFSTIIEKKGRV